MIRNFQTHWNSLLRSSGRSWHLWLLLSVLVLVTDQAIKQAIVALTPYGANYPITSFFNLVHVWNQGAAFSFLADAGGWQRYFFISIGIAVPAVLAWLLRRGVANWMEALAYSLIIGGALGNVIDRIALGFVVDYLDFHWRGWHWPAFNAADMAITGGAALMVTSSFFTVSAASGEPTKRRGN
jgi:signal peptidase II